MNSNIFLYLLFISTVAGLSCNYQGDCQSVADNTNYAVCDTGTCRCLTENGFVGSATTEDKCRCPSDTTETKYDVGYNQGVAYCRSCDSPGIFYWLQPNGYSQTFPFCSDVVEDEEHNRRYVVWERNVRRVFEYYSKQEIAQQIAAGTFTTPEIAPNAGLRAYPINNFGNFSDFIFALFATNNVNGTLRSYSVDTKRGSVCVEADFEFEQTETTSNNKLSYVGCLRINEDDQIYSADLYIPGIGRTLNPPANLASQFKQQLDNDTCTVHTNYCQGANQQYESEAACLTFMSSLSLEDYDRAQGNNTNCRNIYAQLVTYMPDKYCSHIGPNGGVPGNFQCVETTAADYYNYDF